MKSDATEDLPDYYPKQIAESAAPNLVFDQYGLLISEGIVQRAGTSTWECFFPTRSGRVEFIDEVGNSMFIFEPRPSEMRVYMNSCVSGQLGEPEWCYLPVNSSSFRALISISEEGFVVVVDGSQLKLYHHRVPIYAFNGAVKYTPGFGQYHVSPASRDCCVLS